MRITFLIFFVLLAGCRDDVADKMPDPIALTGDAVAHFCSMSVAEMPGPKAEMFLDGLPDPIFFGQVRDGVAYLKEPEKTAEIRGFYVSDMSHAESWEKPGNNNWVVAKDAFFVVGAKVTGGMGAPEIAPFSIKTDAEAFAAKNGGEVMRLDAIPANAVLGGVEFKNDEGS